MLQLKLSKLVTQLTTESIFPPQKSLSKETEIFNLAGSLFVICWNLIHFPLENNRNKVGRSIDKHETCQTCQTSYEEYWKSDNHHHHPPDLELCSVSDPDTDDDGGAAVEKDTSKTNGNSNNPANINLSGKAIGFLWFGMEVWPRLLIFQHWIFKKRRRIWTNRSFEGNQIFPRISWLRIRWRATRLASLN